MRSGVKRVPPDVLFRTAVKCSPLRVACHARTLEKHSGPAQAETGWVEVVGGIRDEDVAAGTWLEVEVVTAEAGRLEWTGQVGEVDVVVRGRAQRHSHLAWACRGNLHIGR